MALYSLEFPAGELAWDAFTQTYSVDIREHITRLARNWQATVLCDQHLGYRTWWMLVRAEGDEEFVFRQGIPPQVRITRY
jgi:hypothetical protein